MIIFQEVMCTMKKNISGPKGSDEDWGGSFRYNGQGRPLWGADI